MTAALDIAVRTVIRECLGLEPGEEFLAICNPVTEGIGSLMRIHAQGEGAEATLAVISERDSHAAEPPATVAAAMLAADAVVAPTIQSLSHTAARKAATDSGARIASMPGVTEDMLARLMGVEMKQLRERGALITSLLNGGSEARITCPRGSELRLGIVGRAAITDAGDLSRRGAFGNLPCGESFIAPVEGTAEGKLVVDGSIAGIGKVESPVELTVEGGHLMKATGAEGEKLMELLTAHGHEGTNVAELGIGTNEQATLTGNVLEDEKILGTCHVAFGASAAIGGTVQVPVHLDCVVLEPTVEVDEVEVVHDGKLLV